MQRRVLVHQGSDGMYERVHLPMSRKQGWRKKSGAREIAQEEWHQKSAIALAKVKTARA